MTISEQLLAVPQRETAGEDSDDAFAFQKSWALYSILNSHLLGKDYLYIFEYHDDILVLDSEDPKSIEFVQVKKSDKNSWTIMRLSKQPDSGGNSIIGKLYAHVVNFPGAQIKLRFVSDMHFSFWSGKVFCANVLKSEQQDQLREIIKCEHSKLQNPDLKMLWFEQCVLSFDSHAEQLLGAVEKFIISVFGNGAAIRASALNDTLLRRAERGRYTSGRIHSFEELRAKKGIGRSEVEKLISEIKISQNSNVSWVDVSIYVDQITNSPREKLIYKGEYLRLSNRLKVNPDDAINSAMSIGLQAFNGNSLRDEAKVIIAHYEGYLNQNSSGIASSFTQKQLELIGILAFCTSMMSAPEAK